MTTNRGKCIEIRDAQPYKLHPNLSRKHRKWAIHFLCQFGRTSRARRARHQEVAYRLVGAPVSARIGEIQKGELEVLSEPLLTFTCTVRGEFAARASHPGNEEAASRAGALDIAVAMASHAVARVKCGIPAQRTKRVLLQSGHVGGPVTELARKVELHVATMHWIRSTLDRFEDPATLIRVRNLLCYAKSRVHEAKIRHRVRAPNGGTHLPYARSWLKLTG